MLPHAQGYESVSVCSERVVASARCWHLRSGTRRNLLRPQEGSRQGSTPAGNLLPSAAPCWLGAGACHHLPAVRGNRLASSWSPPTSGSSLVRAHPQAGDGTSCERTRQAPSRARWRPRPAGPLLENAVGSAGGNKPQLIQRVFLLESCSPEL